MTSPDQPTPAAQLETAADYATLLAPLLDERQEITDLCGEVALWTYSEHDSLPSTVPLTGPATDWQALAEMALDAALHYRAQAEAAKSQPEQSSREKALLNLLAVLWVENMFFQTQYCGEIAGHNLRRMSADLLLLGVQLPEVEAPPAPVLSGPDELGLLLARLRQLAAKWREGAERTKQKFPGSSPVSHDFARQLIAVLDTTQEATP